MSLSLLEFFNRTLDDTGNVKEITGEVLDYIREKYSPIEVPSCRVCGAELTAVRSSGSEIEYAHVSTDDTPFREWQDHYSQSKWTMTRTDDQYVIALLDAYVTLSKKN